MPSHSVDVTVNSRTYTIRTVARTPELAEIKVQGYVEELQTRLAAEAILAEVSIGGRLVEQYATRSISITPLGVRRFEEAHPSLTIPDIIILGTVRFHAANPAALLDAIRRQPETELYSAVGVASRIERLHHAKLVRVSSERDNAARNVHRMQA